MTVESHRGLRLEVTSRPMSGPLVPGEPPRKIVRYLLGLPAAMILVLLVAPMVRTASVAFDADRAGFGNFLDVLTDPGAQRALWHTAIWIAIAVGVTVAGFYFAVLSRAVERWWLAFMIVLVLPFGASALTSGVAFRLLFDPVPERGTVSAVVHAVFDRSPVWLGSGLVWVVLVSAFSWSWLGFAVSLFRAGLQAVPDDLLRRIEVEGRIRHIPTFVRSVRPVGAIILLTLVVAAARLFDLLLISTPGPVQDEVDTVAVYWWRLTVQSSDQGRPAALAVLSFCGLGLLALLLSRAMVRPRRIPNRPPPWWRPRGRRTTHTPWWSVVGGGLIGLMWLFPIVVLVATALQGEPDASTVGWWQAGAEPPNLHAFAAAADAGLVRSLLSTLVVALGATGLLMLVAVVAAPALAVTVPRRLSSVLAAILTVLAVAPVQMYAVPLREAFAALDLVGTRLPLILVHAAAGLPLAILVLRAVLVDALDGRALDDALLGQTGTFTGLRRLWDQAGPALVAVAVMEFVLVWNDFIISFLVSGTGASPLTLVLWGQARQFSVSAGVIAASAASSAIPPMLVLLATWRRWVVPGLTGGVLR